MTAFAEVQFCDPDDLTVRVTNGDMIAIETPDHHYRVTLSGSGPIPVARLIARMATTLLFAAEITQKDRLEAQAVLHDAVPPPPRSYAAMLESEAALLDSWTDDGGRVA